MQGTSPRVDIQLVVEVRCDGPASADDALGSPCVTEALGLRRGAARCAGRHAAGGTADPSAAPVAEAVADVAGAAAEASAPAAGRNGGTAEPAQRTMLALRAEMAHRLALEYASQYRYCHTGAPAWCLV